MKRAYLFRGSGVGGLIAGILVAASSQASAQALDAADGAEAGQEIIVTGSRIAMTGMSAPTPVTVVGNEQLTAMAPPSIGEALKQLPAFGNSIGNRGGGSAVYGGSFLNLRSLGANRNLILLDGKRFPPSSQIYSANGFVNIESMPQALVSRVETVTGGASAAYGSDAVSGVVNFILDTRYEGLKAEAYYGISTRGDGQTYHASLTAGAPFADGRGHVVVSGEWTRDQGVKSYPYEDGCARPWLCELQALAANPVAGATPSLITIYNARSIYNFEGVISTGPLAGTTFNPDSTPRPYDWGSVHSGIWQSGGDGYNSAGIYSVSQPNWRANLFSRVSYEVVDDVTVYAEGLFSHNQSKGNIGIGGSIVMVSSGVPITIDNAYLAPETRQMMVDAGVTQFGLQRHALPLIGGLWTDVYRVVGGVDATLFSDWDFKSYFAYARTDNTNSVDQNGNMQNYRKAIDAVFAPDGSIVCRSTLTDPMDGCVPMNIMGARPVTDAQYAYVYGDDRASNVGTQLVFEAVLSGRPLALPAGDVGVAVGAGYRKETLDAGTNPIANLKNPYTGGTGAWIFYNQPAIKGSNRVAEVFGELDVPLLADLPGVNSLSVNGAIRYTDYRVGGGATTYKAGLVYEPVDDLRLRGTYSRDIRAANLVELFSPGVTGYGFVRDPEFGNVTNAMSPTSSGNPNLKPEKGTTKTLGVVYTPSWLSGFSASIDWYDIKLKGAIDRLTNQQIVDQCFDGLAEACDNIVRDPGTNVILRLFNRQQNLSSRHIAGVDFEFGYQRPLRILSLDGTLNARLFANYVDKIITRSPGLPVVNRAGEVGMDLGGLPHWRGLLALNYNTDSWGFGAQTRYVGGGSYDKQLIAARGVENEFSPMVTTDINISRQIGSMNVYAVVTNLWDKNPPLQPITGLYVRMTNMALYDTFGRSFRVGVKFSL